MSDKIVIGISDQKVSKSPNLLVTYALGSCVGISLYDHTSGVGGLAHIMLPNSKLIPGAAGADRSKFADTAIEDMINSMEKLGANRGTTVAKIAGGANMFKATDTCSFSNIGNQNINAVKSELARLSIPIMAEDTGADFGRTLYFDLDTGVVKVQALGKQLIEM